MTDNNFIIMVGPRYSLEDVSSGVSSIKLEKGCGDIIGPERPRPYYNHHDGVEVPDPIAGPIIRHTLTDCYQARCETCGRKCKVYKRKNEPAMWRWARMHRCANLNQVGDTTYVPPKTDRRPW